MNAAVVEQVRAYLRETKLAPTAAAIAETIELPVLEVGRALDDLKGQRHATEDSLHRWRITDKGRLATKSEAAPRPMRNSASRPSAADGRTIIARIVEAVGDECLTSTEIAERIGIDKAIVQQNLAASGKKHGLVTAGKRGPFHLWRRADPPATASAADTDRGAIAAGQDREEAERRPDSYHLLADAAKVNYRSARDQLPDTVKAAMSNRPPPNVQVLIADICDEIKALLLDKNRKYGNSALQPMRVFSKADPIEQINVRLDDKLSRLLSAQADDEEDAEFDLLGYLVLKRVAKRLPR